MSFAAVLSRLAKLENPYPGLRPFDTAEAHLFFGRDQQVLDLSDRLGRNHFVAVLGLSGSGKSSLVRAGLIPALQRSRLLEPGKTWRVAITRPSGAPFACLAAQLNCDPADLRASSHGLIDWSTRQLNSQQEALLVVIDQFEELFRYKDTSAHAEKDANAGSEAAAFISLLLASSRSLLPIYIVITMRTDYLGDCAEFPDFPEALNESQYLVPRLTREQRRQAIEGPLGRVRISSALVERILNDAGDEPDQLPILQHALMRTWGHWHAASPENTRSIDDEDYEAVGGFSGALNQHADELLQTPAAVAAPTFVEMIFKRLTALGRGNRERRDPGLLSEIWEVCCANSEQDRQRVNDIIDVFRQGEATFLEPREGPLKPETFVDIAHESLIRNWKILAQKWLPEEERQAKTLIELLNRANGWRAHEKDLLTGLDLAGAMQWDSHRNPSPQWAEHYIGPGKLADVQSFLAASHKQFLRSARRNKFLVFTLVLLLLGALFFSFKSLREQETAESLDLAGRAEGLISLGRSSEAIATAKKAFHVEQTPQARAALAHSFPQQLFSVTGHSAVFSPDERQILTANADHTARLWNAATGVLLATLLGHNDDVKSARFSPDGKRIVTGSADHTARLWDATASKQITVLSNHTGDVNLAVFSPDGQLIATASSDATARVWDGFSGLPIAMLSGHTAAVNTVMFSPDNTRVVTASHDSTARVWNAQSGQFIALLKGHTGDVRTAVFSPDGQSVVTAGADKTARVWNSANGQSLGILQGHTGALNSATFSKDGKFIITASDDQTAAIWNATTYQLVTKLVGHAGPVNSAVFSRDGQHVVTAGRDGTVHIWNAATGSLIADLTGHAGFVFSANFSTNGLTVISAGEDNTARLWNIRAAAEAHTILTGHTDGVNTAAFSPKGDRIVTASLDNSAQVWNAQTGKPLLKLTGHAGSVSAANFSPDGRRIVTASSDHTAWIWDATSGAVLVKLIGHAEDVNSAMFSPDGLRVLTASNDKTARISDAGSGRLLTQLTGQHALILNAAFSPDGKRVATAGDDKSAWIWDASTGKVLQKLQGHTGTVWTAAFSPDGEQLVTASDDGTARVWNANTGKQTMLLQGHAAAVYSAVFSPNGKYIATASYDKTVRLWDAANGQVVAKLEDHSDSVSTAAFSRDGKSLVSASLDHTADIFSLVTLSEMETLLTSK